MKDSIFNFDKREAVDAVRAQRARTIALLEDLTEAQWETEIVPGWRTREVAAHLVSTDEASLTGKFLLWGIRQKPIPEIEQWNERQVKENHLVVGMVDDVLELMLEQSRIDGMDDRLHAGYRVIELEVTVAIPGERSDPGSGRDAQPRQCAGEPARARVRVAIRIAMDRTFDGARHDLGVAVIAVRVPDQR